MTIKALFPIVRPTLNLDFANTKVLDPRVTFARASTATFVGSNGLIQTAATGVPRFDHNPTTGESLGLLVEDARTNNLTYSEDTSQWATPTNITLSQNQTTAPDNLLTADQYLETAVTGLHVQDSIAATFVTSTVYTYSVFVKSIGGRNFEIGYPATIFTGRFARFTLSGSGSVQGSDAGVTASIQAFGNGWYRCSATNTCASGAGSRIGNFIIDGSFSRNYAGDITKGLFIWGATLEAGAFATSYIPTVAATATRAADVASVTGTNFSSWYNQTEGTVFADAKEYPFASTLSRSFYGFDNSASPSADFNRQWIWNGNTTLLNNSVYTSSSGPTAAEFSSTIINEQKRTALAYKVNDYARSYNGGAVVTDPSGNLPVGIDRLGIGSSNNTQHLSGTIKRLTYWPVRLGNNILQTITQ